MALVDADGKTVFSVGDVETPVCPRSSLKPLQALAFIESGAIDAFGLGLENVALSCASHSGQPEHVDAVAAGLERIGCEVDMLECGPHLPIHTPSAHALLRAGIEPSALHNNCSGKHSGFLALARQMGVDVSGYTRPDHPVQTLVAETIEHMVDFDIRAHLVGPDGCHAPNYALPLEALAMGIARLGVGAALSASRAKAAHLMRQAIRAHPLLLAGEGRACTVLSPHIKGDGFVKSGAEGVYIAALPDQGLGLALKIDDGVGRASQVAVANALHRLGAFEAENDEIQYFLKTSVVNTRRESVGYIGASENWAEFEIPELG
jgi:L-asparaginase II